jgi:hypothetical protein
MGFDVSISYGTANTPIAISGVVHPEEITASAVNIRVRLPKEAGANQYTVRISSSEKESVFVTARHILQATAVPQIEVEAVSGDMNHAVEVQAQVADGPIMRGACPMGCTVTLSSTW